MNHIEKWLMDRTTESPLRVCIFCRIPFVNSAKHCLHIQEMRWLFGVRVHGTSQKGANKIFLGYWCKLTCKTKKYHTKMQIKVKEQYFYCCSTFHSHSMKSLIKTKIDGISPLLLNLCGMVYIDLTGR
jgi:hypothetical protein